MSVAGYPRSGAPQAVGWSIRHLPAAPASYLVFSRLDLVLLLDLARWDDRVKLAPRYLLQRQAQPINQPLSHSIYYLKSCGDGRGTKWQCQEHISDTEVLTWASLTSIYTIFIQSLLRWAGHVVRVKDHCLLKKLLFCELSQGKRSQGGQKKCFKDTLKVSLKSFGIAPNCSGISGAG